ncbi:uncharacterized protein LOC128952444 [Oppia nitens]|uniref:uncharacterized protein LOC128952444 n=1 Tax=Oppia nitens TaxID=1686743 RepID=UPI0023DB3302|nr:uncharacterized protein LOC128952444 [Oppia nitens]
MAFKQQLKRLSLLFSALLLIDQFIIGSTDPNELGLQNNGNFDQSGGPIGSIVGTGTQTIRKGTLSGLARALDDRLSQVDYFGNPHLSMPEDLPGHILFCTQLIYSGLYAMIYLIIRYPFKLLSKTMLLLVSISYIANYGNWCINPIAWLDFTSEGRKINQHIERLAQFKTEFIRRIMWITDKARHDERRKYACCAWQDYKSKSIEEVPEAQSFVESYFNRLYKIDEWVYCWSYRSLELCKSVDLKPTNEEPDRVVPQSMGTVVFELFDKYI